PSRIQRGWCWRPRRAAQGLRGPPRRFVRWSDPLRAMPWEPAKQANPAAAQAAQVPATSVDL
ncbi:MAG: hypothetical protein ACRDRG_06900, partial [Pseudonocardiaceae bacterium]